MVGEFMSVLTELAGRLDPETATEKMIQHSPVIFEGISELIWVKRALKRLSEVILDPTSGKKLAEKGIKSSRSGNRPEEREFAYSARIAHNYRLVYWVCGKQLVKIDYAGNRDASYLGVMGNGKAL